MAEEKKLVPAKLRLVSEKDSGRLEGAKLRLAAEGEVQPSAKLRLAKGEPK